MRAKIPQLREALQSRFTIEHHGVMVAQLLAHIDTLDLALQNLTERIELVLEPHAEIVELLCTIPGVQAHAAQVLIAECGLDMSVFPTVGHFASRQERARAITSQPAGGARGEPVPDRRGSPAS
jgi:transposase